MRAVVPSARIRLEIDPQTGRRTVVVSYESDSDALPHEHEEEHRALVQKLFEGGLAREGDTIKVEREGEAVATPVAAAASAESEGVKQRS
jgi:hypothetical protein